MTNLEENEHMMPTRRNYGSHRLGSRFLVTMTVVGLAVVGLNAPQAMADTAPPPGTPATVSADGLPTWQVNGVVRTQVTVGNIVYVGGAFNSVRPPNTVLGDPQQVSAGNLFAYNITTGDPVPFAHKTNATVWSLALSPDNKTLYVGGDFTTVDGAAHSHIAAINLASNLLAKNFAASVNGRVSAIAVAANGATVYVGGFFNVAKGRSNLAAFTAATGALTGWHPTTDGQVQALVLAPSKDRVIVGGQFYLLDSAASYGMGSLNLTTGARLPWAASNTIKVTNKIGTRVYRNGSIDTLRTDGRYIYGGGWSNGVGAAFEGNFEANPVDGKIIFLNDCHGDTYDLLPMGGVLYSASHSHSCQAIGGFPDAKVNNARVEHRITAFSTVVSGVNSKVPGWAWSYQGQPRSSLLDWFPTLTPGTVTPEQQAAYSLTGNGKYLSVGGEFPLVNGVAQQGLVRFAVAGVAPNKVGPTPTSVVTPTAVSKTQGSVLVTWPAAWDKDNANLTYSVVRIGPAPATTRMPVFSTTQSSRFWQLPPMSFLDSGLTAGDVYQYQLKVTDPFGNFIYSGMSGSVTVSGSAPVVASYSELGPCRLFDTRSGTGSCPGGLTKPVPKAPVGAGDVVTVQVAGTAGVPKGATAVVVNLTAVGATRNTFLTAWPADGTRPTASNLNVSGPGARPNLVVVPLSAGGAFSVFNAAGSVNLVGDISGYFLPGSGASFTAVSPCRLFDTRSGGGVCTGSGVVPKAPVGAGKTITVKVRGAAGVPNDATAVVVNLTAVGATSGTWVAAWPSGTKMPTASNLNVVGAAAIPNLAIVPIGADGTISLYNAAGSVNLLGDISGYFAPGAGNSFSTVLGGPCRLFDTRSGVGNCAGGWAVPQAKVPAKGVLKVQVRGVGFIPNNATAVVVNLTAVGATSGTWVAAWPSGVPMPVVSNLNVNNSSATPNLAIVPIGSDGTISLYNAAGSVDLLGDMSGYFAP